MSDFYVRLYAFHKPIPYDSKQKIKVTDQLEFSFSSYFTEETIWRTFCTLDSEYITLDALIMMIKKVIKKLPRDVDLSHYDLERPDLIEGIEVTIENQITHIHTYIPDRALDFILSMVKQ